ncbi:unnamed protein product [Anisakis simplex]|uniref:RING-type domain-containing protein n=1 Tax=Anisakis simplex TaxID=6269 RepID=A0A0M3K0Z3_ANISI|nr:unnamed protein product [Anisakis simplex]
MNDDEKWRIEHAKLHAKHKGHEQMHMEMFLILIVTLVVAQIALVQWKKRHFKSYQLCTLLGMWLIPVFVCVQREWWRFLVTWVLYSVFSTFIWFKATRPQISGTTPRFVYTWFLFLHKLSYVLGIGGYLLIMFTLLGVNVIFGMRPNVTMDAGLLLLQYYTQDGLPKKILESDVCAVCGNRLDSEAYEGGESESTYRLTCGHVFHEFCIRGWCVVGKQQTCPYCKEKVDLKRMFKNPWEKPHLFFGQLLDWIRYLVAWQPLIVTFVQGINKVILIPENTLTFHKNEEIGTYRSNSYSKLQF